MLEMGWAGYVVTSCSICNVRAGLLLAGLQWLYISPWPLAGGHWLADTGWRTQPGPGARGVQCAGSCAGSRTPGPLPVWRHRVLCCSRDATLHNCSLHHCRQRKQPTSDCSGCCSVRSEDREEYEPRPRPLSPPVQPSGPVTKNQYRHLPTVQPSHADTAH